MSFVTWKGWEHPSLQAYSASSYKLQYLCSILSHIKSWHTVQSRFWVKTGLEIKIKSETVQIGDFAPLKKGEMKCFKPVAHNLPILIWSDTILNPIKYGQQNELRDILKRLIVSSNTAPVSGPFRLFLMNLYPGARWTLRRQGSPPRRA